MVSGGMSCIKYLLFAFNLVFFLIGLALIVVGSLAQAHVMHYSLFLTDVSLGGIFVIVVGAIIFVIAFFGCCGAVRENQCMMRTFGALLVFILILEVVAAVLGFVYSAQIETALESGMHSTMQNYTNNQPTKQVWDDLQSTFKCCGVKNASDWETVAHLSPAGSVPDSCCRNSTANCGVNALSNPTKIYVDGCVEQLESTLEHSALAIGIAAICFAAVQLVGITFAFCMASAIKREYELV